MTIKDVYIFADWEIKLYNTIRLSLKKKKKSGNEVELKNVSLVRKKCKDGKERVYICRGKNSFGEGTKVLHIN